MTRQRFSVDTNILIYSIDKDAGKTGDSILNCELPSEGNKYTVTEFRHFIKQAWNARPLGFDLSLSTRSDEIRILPPPIRMCC